ncbi:hypothetical protein [Marinobacterium jannaschii]|uniref:hypothetical protein n=1 Tax=Marinobacterium jannaschii TaxID=64970 RepID=UPI0004898BE8|nr:hypothetical protein [Marinobacterium jannaschii]
MRNLVIAGAIAGAGIAGYLINQSVNQPQDPTQAVLSHVPADTVMFSGQLQPFPMKAYLQSTALTQPKSPQHLAEALQDESDPRARFFGQLMIAYMDAAGSAETFQQTFGLPDEMRSFIYTLGFIPVARYQVADPQAIWTLLDKAEQESGLSHQLRYLKGQSYRAYPLGEDGKTLDLLVTERDGWVSITLDTDFNDAAVTEMAFGLTKPAVSLADSDKLAALQKQHGFEATNISYIDHLNLVTGLTTEKGNLLAEMLGNVVKAGELDLADVRTDACRSELKGVAENWPRIVMGSRETNISAEKTHMVASAVLESKNKVFMDALNSMQGFLPEYLSQPSVFGFGLGLEADKISPALTSIWNDAMTPEYSCQPLQQMQQSMSGNNPMMLGMVTGMAQGVKGVSMSLLDYSLNTDATKPDLDSFEAIVSLSAENPANLVNLAKSMLPQLAQLELPLDGTAVDISGLLPIPPNFDVQPMLALKGKHLVLYTGDKGAAVADQLKTTAPVANGLLSLSVDYQKAMAPMIPMLQMSADPELADDIALLQGLDLRLKLDLGPNPQGVELLTEFDMKVPQEVETAAR